MKRLALSLLALVAASLVSDVARAEPLSLNELVRLDAYIGAASVCRELPAYQRAACRSNMQTDIDIGTSTPLDIWEKDGVVGISLADLHRAVAEFWDEGSLEYICYGDVPKNSIVRFAENCGTAPCIQRRTKGCELGCASDSTCAAGPGAPCKCVSDCTARECADADKDGFFVYQEAERNLSDEHHDTCFSGADCGFSKTCEYLSNNGKGFDARPICQARSCPHGKCTAFHLETVSYDANEVIVHLYFDYAPVPVTVLDVYLRFDSPALTLTDARALPTLTAAAQQLRSSQPSEGELRLSVLGKDSKHPIEAGAIAELVFLRRTGAAAKISFSSDGHRRELSMAPNPGALALAELKKSELWGAPALIPAVSEDSGRLVLHYSFDDRLKPMEQNLSLRGEDLCPLGQRCAVQIDASPPPTTELGRLNFQRRANSLQRGAVETSRTIKGVAGSAAFLDGYANHLELPLTFRAGNKEQDFSLGVWFFSEHDSRTAGRDQVLFSHNSPFEKTQYAVVLVSNDAKTFGLDWLEGSLVDGAAQRRHPIARGLSHGAWRHLAILVNAAPETSGQAGMARFLVNGGSAVEVPLEKRPSCPGFDGESGERLRLHDTGQIAGGRVPEALLLTTRRSNLGAIERVDTNGLSAQTLVREADNSARDAHYSAYLRKLVFASDRSGSSEIWVANADGTEPVQVTKGFGDASRAIAARRPRWAPDGSAIVFESNVFDLRKRDNWISRSSHLYYVAYDAERGQVAIPIPGRSPVTELNYQDLLGSGSLHDYRLTAGTSHHLGVRWQRGRTDSDLGQLMFTTADAAWRTRGIGSITIPTLINGTTTEVVEPLGEDVSLELLALLSPTNAADPQKRLFLRTLSAKGESGRVVVQRKQLMLQVGEGRPVVLTVNGLEQVLAADFSPNGHELVISGIMGSRPVLVGTALPDSDGPGATSSPVRVLSLQPTRVDSVQWMKLEQLYPCNWLGAYRQATGARSGSYDYGFRGGLDELKVYDYVRSEDAFRSEVARGLERLSQGGSTTSGFDSPCGDDFDCPPYHLCSAENRCATVECSASHPCARGACTLQPVPRGGEVGKLVCSVECEADAQCFTQQCLNGPCRFCDTNTRSCEECRTVTQTVAGLQSTRTEGCPDSNSFWCHEGSCITECYSFDNDQSTYLCAPGLEYCSHGKCEAFQWSWIDLSPMTLTGLGEMSFAKNGQDLLPRTVAISQSYPIEIQAFGSEDYGISPEIIVEGRDGRPDFQMYQGAWFEIGRVQVHHRTPEEAQRAPYTLLTPYPITHVRVRLNSESYTSGHTATYAPGSRSFLGYRADVSHLEQIADCTGKPECPAWTDMPRMNYLRSGQPTVIVDAIQVNGQLSKLTSNPVCRYEPTDPQDVLPDTEPVGLAGKARVASARRVPYERVAQADVTWGLLNCAQVSTQPSNGGIGNPSKPGLTPLPVPPPRQVRPVLPAVPQGGPNLDTTVGQPDPSPLHPGMIVAVPSGTFPIPGARELRSGSVRETAQCFVEVDETRTEPCFEWVGSGVSLDPYGDPPQANRTLDYGTFQSFGCDGVQCPEASKP